MSEDDAIPSTPVRSWSELLVALHSRSIIPRNPSQGDHYRSPYAFRGMSCAAWPLATSLERLSSPSTVVEPALLRSFRKYAPRGTFAGDSDWEALAVAQHNGLPTRLLDWSVSPLIATHFATAERQYFGSDGAVWCVDVIALKNVLFPMEMRQALREAKAALFDVSLLEQSYRRVTDFDATHDRFGDTCVFFEPPSIDARIANQTGILSAMNGCELSHHAYFARIAASHPQAVFRVVIDKEAKPEIRDMLDQNNIHERMLFPGLPGLCEWLKRYYGPADPLRPAVARGVVP
jgi:hypothetical protein